MTAGGEEQFLYNGVPVSILNPYWAKQQMTGSGTSIYDAYKAQGIQFAAELLGGGYGEGGAWQTLAQLGAGQGTPAAAAAPGMAAMAPAAAGFPLAQAQPATDYLPAAAPSMKSALTGQLSGAAAPQPKPKNMGFLGFLNPGGRSSGY